MNRHQLIGRLTVDPEKRAMPSGDACTKLRIATNEPYKDQTGQWKDHVEYHDVMAFGRLAEVFAERLKRGDQLYLDGPVRRRRYTGAGGVERDGTYLRVENFEFLDSPSRRKERAAHAALGPSPQSNPPRAFSSHGESSNRHGTDPAQWEDTVPFD